jgi:hypothetical protein
MLVYPVVDPFIVRHPQFVELSGGTKGRVLCPEIGSANIYGIDIVAYDFVVAFEIFNGDFNLVLKYRSNVV